MAKTKTIKVLPSAYLYGTYFSNAQADDKVFGYRLVGNNPISWDDTYAEVAVNYATRDVRVTPHSDTEGRGIFGIGRRSRWYYSLEMHPDPEVFRVQILELMAYSLTGE